MFPKNAGWGPPAPAPHHFTPTYITYWGPNCNWPGASSLHPAGLVTLLGDGSVRFVNESIEWRLWVIVNGIQSTLRIG